MKRQAQTVLVVIAAAIVGVALAFFAYGMANLQARQDESRQDRKELREEIVQDREVIATQQAIVEELQRRCIEAAGCEPIRLPETVQGIQGVQGIPGPRGPRGFTGKTGVGQDGADGTDGTDGETVVGPAGADGKDGQDGAPGPKGDPGTARPGTYSCPAGEYATGFTITDDGTVALTCAALVHGNPNPGNEGTTP